MFGEWEGKASLSRFGLWDLCGLWTSHREGAAWPLGIAGQTKGPKARTAGEAGRVPRFSRVVRGLPVGTPHVRTNMRCHAEGEIWEGGAFGLSTRVPVVYALQMSFKHRVPVRSGGETWAPGGLDACGYASPTQDPGHVTSAPAAGAAVL